MGSVEPLVPIFIPRPIINHPQGDIFLGPKASLTELKHQEVYASSVLPHQQKDWKLHKTMICHLMVLHGTVSFSIYNYDLQHELMVTIGPKNHGILQIPPQYWFAFRSESEEIAYVINFASCEHINDESEKRPNEFLQFNFSAK